MIYAYDCLECGQQVEENQGGIRKILRIIPSLCRLCSQKAVDIWLRSNVNEVRLVTKMTDQNSTEEIVKKEEVAMDLKSTKVEVQKRREYAQQLQKEGLSIREISKKVGVSSGSISYYLYGAHSPSRAKVAKKKLSEKRRGVGPAPVNCVTKFWCFSCKKGIGDAQYHLKGNHGHLISLPNRNYQGSNSQRMTVRKQQELATEKEQGYVNGNTSNGSTNGSVNKNILIGIAFAETERFIANLSERIKIDATVLRRRLSELLGNSPLR